MLLDNSHGKANKARLAGHHGGESGSEISLTSDIATITVSCPHLAAAAGAGEHLLVVMDTTRELTDNL